MATLWAQLQSASKAISEQAQTIAGTMETLAEGLVTRMNEASAEMKQEHERMMREQAREENPHLLLPWETREENKSILVDQAMASILELSSHETTFTHPPDHINDFTFDFQMYIPVVLRLLEIDANLKSMQAHFASRMKEEVFWHNYFMHTRVVRQRVGLSLHDDILPSSASTSTPQPAAAEIVGGVRRLSLLGNEQTMTSESEDEDVDNDFEGSDFDLHDDDFEAVDAEDIDEELLEQEIARELQDVEDSS